MALSITINKVGTYFTSIPIGTKVADIVVSGGTTPYTYTLTTGSNKYQIVGTEVQAKVVIKIDNLESFSVTATDSSTPILSVTSEFITPYVQAAVQSKFNKSNMIYKIVDDIDLGNGILTIPSGCTLDFQGGSFSNGIIKGNLTNIKATISVIFKSNLIPSGTWNIEKIYPEWFGAVGNGVVDCTQSIQSCFDMTNIGLENSYNITIHINNGDYLITKTVNVENRRFNLKMDGNFLVDSTVVKKAFYFSKCNFCNIEFKLLGKDPYIWDPSVTIDDKSDNINNVSVGLQFNGLGYSTLSGYCRNYNGRFIELLGTCYGQNWDRITAYKTRQVLYIDAGNGIGNLGNIYGSCPIIKGDDIAIDWIEANSILFKDCVSLWVNTISAGGSAPFGSTIIVDHCQGVKLKSVFAQDISITETVYKIYRSADLEINAIGSNNRQNLPFFIIEGLSNSTCSFLCRTGTFHGGIIKSATDWAVNNIKVKVSMATHSVTSNFPVIIGELGRARCLDVSLTYTIPYSTVATSEGVYDIDIVDNSIVTITEDSYVRTIRVPNNNVVSILGKVSKIEGIPYNANILSRKIGSTSNMPIQGTHVGQHYYNTDYKDDFIWNGSDWIKPGHILPYNALRYGATSQRPSNLTASHTGFSFFDSTLGIPLFWKGTMWGKPDGKPVWSKGNNIYAGGTSSRPLLSTNDAGYQYYDVTTKQLITWNGTSWDIVNQGVLKWSNDNKIQISYDKGATWEDLSPKFADNIHIKGYYSTIAELPSDAAAGDIYMVGPATGTNTYNMYVKTSSGWVDNGSFTSIQAGVVQELGDSTTEVVSQKVVSDNIKDIKNDIGSSSGLITFNRTEYGYISNDGAINIASSGSNYLMKITDIYNIIKLRVKAKAENNSYNIISWYDSNDNYIDGISYNSNTIYFESSKPPTASYCYIFNRIALESSPEIFVSSGMSGTTSINLEDIDNLSFKYIDVNKLYSVSWTAGSGIDNTGAVITGGAYINRSVSSLFNISPGAIIRVSSNRLYFSVWDYTNSETPKILTTKVREFTIPSYAKIRIELRSVNDLYDISSYVGWIKVLKPNSSKVNKEQDIINVNSYGIYGDGITDNTVLINTLISNIESGTTLYFPRGVYIISNTISISRYIKILGEGASTHKLDGYSKGYEDLIQQGTIFSLKSSSSNITMFKVNGWFAGVSQAPPVEFNNIVLLGNAAYYTINSKDNQESASAGHYIDEDIVHTGINGIDLTGGSNTLVTNCSIFGMSGYGIQTSSFANLRDIICRSCSIGFKITTDVNIQGCNALLCGKGMIITKHGNSIINFRAERCREYGIQLLADVTPEYPMNNLNLLEGIWIEACDYAGIMIKGSNRLMLNGQVQRCGGYYADMTLEQIIANAGNDTYLDKCSNIYSTNIYNNIINVHSNIVGWKDGDSDHNICPYYGMSNEYAMYNSKITIISSKIQAIYDNAFYQKDGDSTTNKIRNSALDINNTLVKYDINNTAHEIY